MVKNETQRERFKRLASSRVNTILIRLEVLGNCANRHYYEYTEEDVRKIFRTIDDKVNEIKGLFRVFGKKEFKL